MKIEKYSVTLDRYGITPADSELVTASVTLNEKDGCLFLNAEAKCNFKGYGYTALFEKYGSVLITLKTEKIFGMVAQIEESPYWAGPVFYDTPLDDNHTLQYALINNGKEYTFILPVTNEDFSATLKKITEKDCMCVSVNAVSADVTEIKGTVAVIACHQDPYKAIELAFSVAVKNKLIKTPLKKDKPYPNELNYLGWCTWDAFYHDVSEEKILNKMEEFKSKKIPVKWVLIDDGWSEAENEKLLSIYEDKTKFPHGLKHTVSILKQKYGIISVGAWHSATAYWQGAAFENENTFKTKLGAVVPKGYEFFKKWHAFLKEQGIDFIKVDTQGNMLQFLKANSGALQKTIHMIDGLEKSANEHFKFMINCMGLGSVNMHSRRYSSMLRNSGDFLPQKEDGLMPHVVKNAYNALFHDALYYCDYDMWWSTHFDAEQNAVLRYISGGPFYLSDKAGETDGKLIKLFVDENGKINRFDNAAKPTPDCLFGYKSTLKLFNTRKNEGAVAVFSFEDASKVSISSKDFGKSGNFAVKDFTGGTEFMLKDCETAEIKLGKNEAKLFLFTPLAEKAIVKNSRNVILNGNKIS